MSSLHPLDDSPFGMGIYPSHRTTGDETIRAAQLARDAGIRWTRDEIGWAGLQPTRGEWRWQRFDRAVDTMRAHGIETLGLLCYSAPWAATGRRPDGTPAGESMPDLDAWRGYVGGGVEHFRDRVHAWEMWNEPNNAGFWGGKPDPRAYARLLAAGYEAAKEADPTCWVMGCNMWAQMPYLRIVFEEGGLDHLDIIGIHPYRYPYTPEHSDFTGEMVEVAALAAEFGGVKPIWLSEVGYATHTSAGGSSEWWAGAALMRTYLLAWSSGYVGKVFWYDFRDDGDDASYNEHNFGIIRRDWTPKMGYTGFKAMADALEGCRPDGQFDLGRNVRALRFRKGTETRLAAWATEMNAKVPIPAPADRVKVIYPWVREVEREAKNGYVMLDVYATPTFIVPA